jgi:hypothetical protein
MIRSRSPRTSTTWAHSGGGPRPHILDLGPDLTLGTLDAEPATDTASKHGRRLHADPPSEVSFSAPSVLAPPV